jgi:hypothetical protein
MFINMVPDHRFNQLKPKSGARVGAGFPRGTRNSAAKTVFAAVLRSMNCAAQWN